jgi:hypothetical protein
MRFLSYRIFNISIFLILLFINGYVFINRNEGFEYKEILSYNQLYQNKNDLCIKNMIFDPNGSIKVELSNISLNQNRWEVQLPDSTKYKSTTSLIIKLKEGVHHYKIKNLINKKIVITFKLNYVKAETYKTNGRQRETDIELLQSSIPFEEDNLFYMNHWTETSPYTSKQETFYAKNLLRDSMFISDNDHSIEKIQKIGIYLLKKLDKHRGIPKDKMDYISPLERLKAASKGDSKVWCGDFSALLSFFSNQAGINARALWIEGNANGIPMAGHSFNEVYIQEFNKWIFIDLTANTFFVQSSEGNYLNTIEFYNLFNIKSTNIKVTTFQNDTIISENLNYNTSFYNDYFNPDIKFIYYYSSQFNKDIYSLFNKFKRYFFPEATFGTYSNNSSIKNPKFYIKQFAFFTFVLFLIYWILHTILVKRKC